MFAASESATRRLGAAMRAAYFAAVVSAVLPSFASGADDESAPTVADFARVRAYEKARIDVIARAAPAVACLFQKGNRAGGGSGVIITEDGYGLTNFHVVAGMLEERIGEAGLPDGKLSEIDVLGIDPTGDVAMFRLRGERKWPHVELGDSAALRIGDYALAMGNPFLLAEDYTPTVTLGIISGLNRYQSGAGEGQRALRYTDCIQVDTSINPGNSGGPLFDLAGRVIGINGRISAEERQRVNVGVGYAISIDQIKRFLPMLRAGLPTKHATAGFTVFDRDRRVAVDEIRQLSPAYRAGLRAGDEIVRFAGRPIHSRNEFLSVLGVYPAHWPTDVVYRRDGREQSIAFRLEDLAFPRAEGPGGMVPAFDLYAPHPITQKANRRAVSGAFNLFQEFAGGAEAVASIREIGLAGTRTPANDPGRDPTRLTLTERREDAAPPSETATPADSERTVRWSLLEAHESGATPGCEVIAADEIDGRIAVVIECKPDGAEPHRLAFDDDDGRLLRIEFNDRTTGKRTSFEYGDYRRAGAVKLPHERRLYLDDQHYATDRFARITVKG